MFGKQKKERFVTIYQNGTSTGGIVDAVLKDTVTGVLYYERYSAAGRAVIPLLGSDGKPIIEPVETRQNVTPTFKD